MEERCSEQSTNQGLVVGVFYKMTVKNANTMFHSTKCMNTGPHIISQEKQACSPHTIVINYTVLNDFHIQVSHCQCSNSMLFWGWHIFLVLKETISITEYIINK